MLFSNIKLFSVNPLSPCTSFLNSTATALLFYIHYCIFFQRPTPRATAGRHIAQSIIRRLRSREQKQHTDCSLEHDHFSSAVWLVCWLVVTNRRTSPSNPACFYLIFFAHTQSTREHTGRRRRRRRQQFLPHHYSHSIQTSSPQDRHRIVSS